MRGLLATLNSIKVLAATFAAALFIDTLGGIRPAQGIYLPAPARYLATFLLWGLLGLASVFGPRAARAAAQLSLLVLLTSAVIGPAGRRLVSFLNTTSALTSQGGNP